MVPSPPSVADARAVLGAIAAAAADAGLRSTAVVVDGGGHLVALERLDGALLASIASAEAKARTAVYFGTETRNLPFDQPVVPALTAAAPYPVAFFPGGVPLRRDGHIVGAVGVGGGTAEQDQRLASVGAARFEAVVEMERSGR